MSAFRIYIAASCSRSNEANDLAELLRSDGHHVMSRWHRDGDKQDNPDSWTTDCLKDLDDIENSDTMVCLTGGSPGRGRRHTELGYALAKRMKIILLGPKEQVFHAYFTINYCDSVFQLRDLLNEW